MSSFPTVLNSHRASSSTRLNCSTASRRRTAPLSSFIPRANEPENSAYLISPSNTGMVELSNRQGRMSASPERARGRKALYSRETHFEALLFFEIRMQHSCEPAMPSAIISGIECPTRISASSSQTSMPDRLSDAAILRACGLSADACDRNTLTINAPPRREPMPRKYFPVTWWSWPI